MGSGGWRITWFETYGLQDGWIEMTFRACRGHRVYARWSSRRNFLEMLKNKKMEYFTPPVGMSRQCRASTEIELQVSIKSVARSNE